MANLTVVIEDELLLRARQRALAAGTSVNALVREYLQDYAGSRVSHTDSLLEMALGAAVGGVMDHDRDELHAR
jgi:hypothetical protein